MKKKNRSKRKRILKDTIPDKPKASISETMRKEGALEGEVFENVNTAVSTSTRSTKPSTKSIGRLKQKGKQITILPAEPPIEFQNDILSVYSQTAGTISLDSVSDIGTGQIEQIKKEQKPSAQPPIQLLQAAKVKATPVMPQKAFLVSDAIFCEKTNFEGPYIAEHRKGDVEMTFINQLIANVLAIVNESGSTDFEFKVTLEREDNGLPKATFELIPKARLSNPIERLNRAYVQYAKFHEQMGVASDCETAISQIQRSPKSETPPPEQQQGSRFSLLSVFNSVFPGLGNQKGK
ncbi:unnamed protein product [Cylicocyclus nassatus]|uniref:Uncharacterized protein n=1 Tax=Cylicocyclus nassatus TaxID=53992 RepID=A0AA36HA52_CYLNA|nr:unnamed protein product [Cylicocyclus nassatus]